MSRKAWKSAFTVLFVMVCITAAFVALGGCETAKGIRKDIHHWSAPNGEPSITSRR